MNDSVDLNIQRTLSMDQRVARLIVYKLNLYAHFYL